LDYLKNEKISKANQKLILNFFNYCFSEDIGEQKGLKYLSTLKIIAKCLPIDLDKVTEEEIRAYVGSIERSALSDWTKHDYKVTLKKFYK
jgi:site-specific recombinase XerD